MWIVWDDDLGVGDFFVFGLVGEVVIGCDSGFGFCLMCFLVLLYLFEFVFECFLFGFIFVCFLG